MGVFTVWGEGTDESRERLLEIILKYQDKFGENAPLIIREQLPEGKQTNEYFIKVYQKALRENKTIDQIITYEWEMDKDVLY